MAKAGDVIKFDLTEDYWLEHPDQFWEEFQHTGQIRIPEELDKWLIGQDAMKERWMLAMEEWVRKQVDIQRMRAEGKGDKDAMKEFLKERPGPYIVIVGEPGTGKSLLIKIVKGHLKKLYKKHGIVLQDVLLIGNRRNPERPKVRYTPAGRGREVRDYGEMAQGTKDFKMQVFTTMLGLVTVIGALMVGTAVFLMVYISRTSDPDIAWFQGSGVWLQWLFYGMMLMVFPMFIYGFVSGRMMPGGARKGERAEVPALIVDNSGDPDLCVDMTQGNASKMFGAVKHDPWQSGGLGTPTQHRVQAGAIHLADKKMFFADEFKNFLQNEEMVIEFLTPLEDGTYPIRGREWHGSGGNASLGGETEDPVDCSFLLIAAMNFDAVPLLNHYPALRNRFKYGVEIRADDEIDATPANEVKLAQFIADESYRFHTPPACKAAVRTIIAHSRRKGSSFKRMKLQMRWYIQDIKISGQIVWGKKDRKWESCSCGIKEANMIHWPDMILAIEEYAKPIEQQNLDAFVAKRKPYRLMNIEGSEVGRVNGMVVISSDSDEGRTGDVATVTAWLQELTEDEREKRPPEGYFTVTGAPVTDKDTWMQNSIRTVRTTIYRMYGVDLARDYYVHVSFVQSDAKSIDGPSAGITMTLSIMSCLGDPRDYARYKEGKTKHPQPVPIRQDTAITGTVENIGVRRPVSDFRDVKVGPIGGVFEKSYGAKMSGIKRIIIPKENYDNTYFEHLGGAEDLVVIGADSVMDFFELMRADRGEKA